MGILAMKIIVIVVLAVIWIKLKLLEKDLGTRLRMSVILFAASLIYETAATPIIMRSIIGLIMDQQIKSIAFWSQIIHLPGNALIILALLNLLPLLRDKQFHRNEAN